MHSGGVVEVESVVAVVWCRSVLGMCVVRDFFVFVVIGVWFGVVLCCVLLQFLAGVWLEAFIVDCVVVVVVVDNG